MDKKEYKKALQTLNILIAKEKGASKLQLMIKKIKCQTELGEDAAGTCENVKSALSQNNLRSEELGDVLYLETEIRRLVVSFTTIDVNTALLLQRCLFQFIDGFYTGQARLSKFAHLRHHVLPIAEEMKKQNKKDIFKQHYSFLDSILISLQNICDVEWKFKCKEVARFLHSYANCCFEISDFQKSNELNDKAIFLLETAFGLDASQYKLYGFCYKAKGSACKDANKLAEAKLCFDKAMSIYQQVEDFGNESERENEISVTSRSFYMVDKKILQQS